MNSTLLDLLRVHQRDGYAAAVAGRPSTDNPWRRGTVGHAAWALGWDVGRVARPAVRMWQLVTVLAVVLPWKGGAR